MIENENKRILFNIEKNYKLFFWTLCGIFMVLWIMLALNDFRWHDELYTMAIVRNSFADIWRITAADVHPPMYYFALKLVALPFVNKQIPARLFSVIPYVILLLYGGSITKKLFGEKVSLLFILLFSIFSSTLFFAVEIRMYSWATLFVFLCAVNAFFVFKENKIKHWILLTLFGIISAYFHYFALLAVMVIYLLLLIAIVKNKSKAWRLFLLSVFVCLLIYSPWMIEFAKQLKDKADNGFWIPELSLTMIAYYFTQFFGSFTIVDVNKKIAIALAGISFIVYLSLFIFAFLSKDKRMLIFCAICISIPLIVLTISLIVTFTFFPIVIARYFILFVPFICLIGAIGIDNIKNKFIISIALVLLLGVFGANAYHFTKYRFSLPNNYISYEFVDEINDYDCALFFSDQLVYIDFYLYSYNYDKEIYGKKRGYSDANPNPHSHRFADFDSSLYQTGVLFVDKGAEIPAEVSELYTTVYLKTLVTTSGKDGQSFGIYDVYSLLRK